VRLPAASREDDDPSASSRLPQLQRGLLIVAQLEAGDRQLRYPDERRGFVRHADTLRPELGRQQRASMRREAVDADAPVPANTGKRREIDLVALIDEHDSSAVKCQAHVPRSSETCAIV
jgi:hypothetical protein